MAFDQLFLSYYKPLCHFALSILFNADDAEEATQKVFINLWENRKKIICPDKPKSYLYKSTYNQCLKEQRIRITREKYQKQYFIQLQNTDDNDDAFYNLETIEHLYDAIQGLPEKCRHIFILNKLEGLTQKEIAEYLSVSTKTVENQIRNAIVKLRHELKPFLHLLPGYFLFLQNF